MEREKTMDDEELLKRTGGRSIDQETHGTIGKRRRRTQRSSKKARETDSSTVRFALTKKKRPMAMQSCWERELWRLHTSTQKDDTHGKDEVKERGSQNGSVERSFPVQQTTANCSI
jgi:hypothetical protein